MKVSNITPYERRKDNKPYWKVDFEEVDIPLITYLEPWFEIGSEIPKEKLKRTGDGKFYTYSKDDGDKAPRTQKTTPKSYTADPAKMESIELQNNKNNAVQLYCHVTEPAVPFNKDLLKDIFREVQTLGNENYLVKEAKKMGAVEQ